jgi:hypothetical protein
VHRRRRQIGERGAAVIVVVIVWVIVLMIWLMIRAGIGPGAMIIRVIGAVVVGVVGAVELLFLRHRQLLNQR